MVKRHAHSAGKHEARCVVGVQALLDAYKWRRVFFRLIAAARANGVYQQRIRAFAPGLAEHVNRLVVVVQHHHAGKLWSVVATTTTGDLPVA